MTLIQNSDVVRGRKRLAGLMPAARAAAAKLPPAAEPTEMSDLGRSIQQYLKHANFDSLAVHEMAPGKWRAAIVLKNVPPGVPTVLGTPSDAPLATKALAEAAGYRLLVLLLNQASGIVAEPAPAVFELFGSNIPVATQLLQDKQVIADLAAASPGEALRYGSMEDAARRVEEAVASMFPTGFSPAAFDAMDRHPKIKLITVLTLACGTGLFRYPAWTVGATRH